MFKMPFKKRNRRKNDGIKQRNVIKRRLMEISIRVDNYIYKHKPIAVDEANKYIDEISPYKTQCNEDPRILQVIEKLTRILKSIIAEATNKCTTNTRISSSDKEENIDLFTESSPNHEQENILSNGITKEAINNLSELPLNLEKSNIIAAKVNDFCHEVVGRKESVNAPETPNIIINSDNENEMQDYKLNTKNQNQNFNVCKLTDTSSVSVSLITTNNTFSTTNKLSKQPTSKIDELKPNNTNIEGVETLKHNSKTINFSKMDAHNLTSKRSQQLISMDNNYSQNVQKSILQEIVKCGDDNSKKNNSKINVLPDQHITNSINKNVCVKQVAINKRKEPGNDQKKTRKPRKKANNPNITPTVKGRKKATKNKKSTPSTISDQDSSLLLQNKTLAQTKKYQHSINVGCNEVSINNAIETHNAFVNKPINKETLISKQMDSLTIYNESTENDLSWVENIRYVREVGDDEFDPMLNSLDYKFWHSFSLPSGFDDHEFL